LRGAAEAVNEAVSPGPEKHGYWMN
jgi:hypothetical protein